MGKEPTTKHIEAGTEGRLIRALMNLARNEPDWIARGQVERFKHGTKTILRQRVEKRAMALEWTLKGGDGWAEAETGKYEIEQAGHAMFWAFADERPVGTYRHFHEAQRRCEEVHEQRTSDQCKG